MSNGCTLQLHYNNKADFGYVNIDGSSYWNPPLKEYTHTHQFLGFFRNYSEQDINEMQNFSKKVLEKSKHLPITYKLLITKIEDHTLFDLFGKNIELF